MVAAASLKVLVVDDQRSIRALVRECLTQMGCRQITECENGVEALARLRIQPAHLVISDLNMPELDGLGLLRAIRQDPNLNKTIFIMLTSRGEAELVREAVSLRVNNYLTKPFSLGALQSKIVAVLGPVQ